MAWHQMTIEPQAIHLQPLLAANGQSVINIHNKLRVSNYKQDSFVTEVLSAALATHCGSLWRTLVSLFVVCCSISK